MTAKDYQTLKWICRVEKAPQSKLRPKALQTLARAGLVTFERGMVLPTENGRQRASQEAYSLPASSA